MAEKLIVPSLVDAVHCALQTRILSGELAAGTPLTEKDVAESYDVARPTAKAALDRLIYNGLLRRSTNKSARVPSLIAADVADLYYSRGFLEREAISAVAGRRQVPQAALEAMAQIRQAIASQSITLLVEADVAFHRALIDSLRSPRLSRLYLSLMGEVHLCMAQVQTNRLLQPATIHEEHERLLAAVEAGDESLAVAEISAHLTRARDQLVAHLEEKESVGHPGQARSAEDGPRASVSR